MSLLFVSLFLLSCQNEESSVDSILENVYISPNYKNYKQARIHLNDLFLNQYIDVTQLNQYIKTVPSSNHCEIEIESIRHIDGGKDFFNLSCTITQSIVTIIREHPQIRSWDQHQLKTLFEFNLNPSSSRAPNCLDNFNSSMNTYMSLQEELENCPPDDDFTCDLMISGLMENIMNSAINAYDECCSKGGSGCK